MRHTTFQKRKAKPYSCLGLLNTSVWEELIMNTVAASATGDSYWLVVETSRVPLLYKGFENRFVWDKLYRAR